MSINTERRDPWATYSSPSVVGLILGVGNVGESLAPYKDSDTFLTRNVSFTWEEVHKDAHMWVRVRRLSINHHHCQR